MDTQKTLEETLLDFYAELRSNGNINQNPGCEMNPEQVDIFVNKYLGSLGDEKAQESYEKKHKALEDRNAIAEQKELDRLNEIRISENGRKRI